MPCSNNRKYPRTMERRDGEEIPYGIITEENIIPYMVAEEYANVMKRLCTQRIAEEYLDVMKIK